MPWSDDKPVGVYFLENIHKWQAGIQINYKYIYLGRFETMDEAVKARRAYNDKQL